MGYRTTRRQMKAAAAPKPKPPKWVRDGTIVCGRDVQIDLRKGRYGGRDTVWLTIKARNEVAEETAQTILEALNLGRDQ